MLIVTHQTHAQAHPTAAITTAGTTSTDRGAMSAASDPAATTAGGPSTGSDASTAAGAAAPISSDTAISLPSDGKVCAAFLTPTINNN
jgi:hypothetical protein